MNVGGVKLQASSTRRLSALFTASGEKVAEYAVSEMHFIRLLLFFRSYTEDPNTQHWDL